MFVLLLLFPLLRKKGESVSVGRTSCFLHLFYLLVLLVLVLLLVLVFLLFAPLAGFLLLVGAADGGGASSV